MKFLHLREIVSITGFLVVSGLMQSVPPVTAEPVPVSFGVILDPASVQLETVAGHAIPPDGSLWDEYYCCAPGGDLEIRSHVQTGYADNGDGVVSVGDMVALEGVYYAVEDVGDRYFVDARNGNCDPWPECAHVDRYVLEPLQPPDPDDPEHRIYVRVNFPFDGPLAGGDTCRWRDLTDDGIVNAGDRILWSYVIVYIADVVHIGTYVRLQGFGVVPVLPTTWGGVKTRYSERHVSGATEVH